MKRFTRGGGDGRLFVSSTAFVFALGAAAATAPAQRVTAPPMAVSHPVSIEAQNRLVAEHCAGCHDDEMKTGGLTLEHFDAAQIEKHPELAEKMIRKLRAGLMPPPGAPSRPDAARVGAFVTSLETRIDRAAAAHPNPGWRPFQRLNRAEFGRAVHDLLAIDVDVSALLPPDTVSHSFDNIADEQSFSPTLMEGYLRA
ncbi:MAG TPA: DUF1587 domain-containing protein, partial [Vicinamibacterales bacterium]